MGRITFNKNIQYYIGCADLHITSAKPKYRKDNFWETVKRKVAWIVQLSNLYNAPMLIGGDLFDTSRISYDVLNPIIEILKTAKNTPIVVAGQHDMVFHLDDIENTPLWNLAISGHVIVLGDDLFYKGVYGQQYNGVIPKDPQENAILLVHRSITPDEPPFFLPDAISAKDAMEEYNQFRVVISGDYHSGFHKTNGKTDIINCGPMLRTEKDKMNVKPCVWLIGIDGSNVTVTPKYIPIDNPEDVFDIDQIEYDDKHSVTIDTTKLRTLMGTAVDTLVFKDIVFTLYKSSDFTYLAESDVQKILTEGGIQ